MKLFLTTLGAIPLLMMDSMGYFVSGIVLTFVAYFLSCFIENHALVDDKIAYRMFFWLPFTISAELYLLVEHSSLMWYFFPIIISVLGLFMPLKFLMEDPRFPSSWLREDK